MDNDTVGNDDIDHKFEEWTLRKLKDFVVQRGVRVYHQL